LAIEGTLQAVGILYGPALLDAPALGQTHALAAQPIDAGAPLLDGPAVAQAHVLEASALQAGQPTLAAPAVAQAHVLEAVGLVGGVPALQAPAMAQAHVLEALGLTYGPGVLAAVFLSIVTGVTPPARILRAAGAGRMIGLGEASRIIVAAGEIGVTEAAHDIRVVRVVESDRVLVTE
jgi:hypothetical protein